MGTTRDGGRGQSKRSATLRQGLRRGIRAVGKTPDARRLEAQRRIELGLRIELMMKRLECVAGATIGMARLDSQ